MKESICQIRGVLVRIFSLFFLSHFKEHTLLFYAKNGLSDQTPRFAVSDLGLHCLSIFFVWDANSQAAKTRWNPIVLRTAKTL